VVALCFKSANLLTKSNVFRWLMSTPRARPNQKKEAVRFHLLKKEEESWCQKSRAVWLQSGDCNTKFFHNVASAQKNHKHIWDLHSEEGRKITGQVELKEEAVKYFKNLGNIAGVINEDQTSVENL
jgi:hypothetical protein